MGRAIWAGSCGEAGNPGERPAVDLADARQGRRPGSDQTARMSLLARWVRDWKPSAGVAAPWRWGVPVRPDALLRDMAASGP